MINEHGNISSDYANRRDRELIINCFKIFSHNAERCAHKPPPCDFFANLAA